VRVLIADDSVTSRHALVVTLRKWGYEVLAAHDGEEAWQMLQEPDAPRLAILDWMMPGRTGLEICRSLRTEGPTHYTYVLLLTARSEVTDLVEGMEAGADDYISKPFNVQELNVRLRAGRRIVELQTELVAAREKLREQATRDALTHVWNRYSILEILRKELARSSRERRHVGIVMTDMDYFKKVNDTHGHLAGDAVLREAAQRMQTRMRSYDAIGRYGGEEFLIVLPGCGRPETLAQAERLRTVLSADPVRLSETSISITASFGCTSVEPADIISTEGVIHLADEALYRAKRIGRNAVEWLTSESDVGESDNTTAVKAAMGTSVGSD
jgi:two-component system, cell cycle response regulator